MTCSHIWKSSVREAAACKKLIRDSAADPEKRKLFDRLAAHLTVLASEIERVMLERGKQGRA